MGDPETRRCAIMNERIWRIWRRKCRHEVRRFQQALEAPLAAQQKQLERICSCLKGSQYAAHHEADFSKTPLNILSSFPVMHAQDLELWTRDIQAGKSQVLTTEPVETLVPTSGSTGPMKLIPLTASGRYDIANAMRIWMGNLLRESPHEITGSTYVATSPALSFEQGASKVPIGFAQDTAYLHRFEQAWLPHVLAVPFSVAGLRGDMWKHAVRDALWNCQDLEFLSLWHPSYLQALFYPDEWRQLPERWPVLRVISCWADGVCSSAAEALHSLFPQAVCQPKGLWLTEGVVSIPFQGKHPLAITTSYLEFEREDGTIVPVNRLEVGERVRPLLTNRFGLIRYLLGDLVEVTGRLYQTPTVRWVGRADHVSDLCGEKLSEAQVEIALRDVEASPDARLWANAESVPPCYRVNGQVQLEKLEQALKRNPHYAWARELHQLGPVLSAEPASALHPPQIGHWKESRLQISPVQTGKRTMSSTLSPPGTG